LELIGQIGCYCVRGYFLTINRQVKSRACFEPPDRVGVEFPLNPCPRAALRGSARVLE
jgi:hypothetical protein